MTKPKWLHKSTIGFGKYTNMGYFMQLIVVVPMLERCAAPVIWNHCQTIACVNNVSRETTTITCIAAKSLLNFIPTINVQLSVQIQTI